MQHVARNKLHATCCIVYGGFKEGLCSKSLNSLPRVMVEGMGTHGVTAVAPVIT